MTFIQWLVLWLNGLIVMTIITIAVEAFTEIFTTGDIFTELRGWLSRKNNFLERLVSCGYCFSVWGAILFSWVVPLKLTSIALIDVVIFSLVIHRLSNVFHELLSRWFSRHPNTSVVHNIGDENGKKRN